MNVARCLCEDPASVSASKPPSGGSAYPSRRISAITSALTRQASTLSPRTPLHLGSVTFWQVAFNGNDPSRLRDYGQRHWATNRRRLPARPPPGIGTTDRASVTEVPSTTGSSTTGSSTLRVSTRRSGSGRSLSRRRQEPAALDVYPTGSDDTMSMEWRVEVVEHAWPTW